MDETVPVFFTFAGFNVAPLGSTVC